MPSFYPSSPPSPPARSSPPRRCSWRRKASRTPEFQILVGGTPLETVFGTEGSGWHWQPGGPVEIRKTRSTLSLRDLTGFEGRCDAVLFSASPGFSPPEEPAALAAFRRRALGIPDLPPDAGSFDLVVTGGGIAGTCAAISASRHGLRVALVQDRPVLGGNNSSEVRVWLHGDTNLEPYPRLGDVVRELEPRKRAHAGPANSAEIYEDERRLARVRSEKNVTLFLEHRANGAEVKDGRLAALVAQEIRSGRRIRLRGRWFVDATGDGALRALAGADFEMTEQGHMGPSNLWHAVDTGSASPFPRCPWALDLSDKPFPGRGKSAAQGVDARSALDQLGQWFWECGFDWDPLDVERMRDWNLRAMYGAWDALKNVDGLYPNHRLHWAAYISKANFGKFKKPFWAPYRILYSRNIPNLFMAGRDVSVTHEALGTVRVMRTGGMMGEVVGLAAYLCARHSTDPRGVYRDHLDELKELLRKGVPPRAGGK